MAHLTNDYTEHASGNAGITNDTPDNKSCASGNQSFLIFFEEAFCSRSICNNFFLHRIILLLICFPLARDRNMSGVVYTFHMLHLCLQHTYLLNYCCKLHMLTP